jgi:hypothetical protein
MNAVFNESAGFTNYTPYTQKQQLILKQETSDTNLEPRVLDAVFLLNDPKESPPAQNVNIAPLAGTAAMLAMINCAFSLDPSDRTMMVSNFQNVGRAISERLEFYALSYPREHDLLPSVREAVIKCVS